MADLSITAASVVKSSGANVDRQGIAAATITAGQVVYKDPDTGKYGLADSNSATAAIREPDGIALNGASANQPVAVLLEGDVTIGATLTPGTEYWLSDTPGGICPRADVASGEYPSMIGIAKSASVLSVRITSSGVAI